MAYRDKPEPKERARARIRMTECPACHARVLVRGGTCPSCQAQVDAVEDDGRRVVHLADGAVVPTLCVGCGVPSSRTVAVEVARSDDGVGPWGRALIFIMRPLAGLLVRGRATVRVRVDVPQCKACASSSLRARHVDFDRMELSLLVHRDFAEALR